MPESKWIPELTFTMPLPAAAAIALKARVTTVLHWLPLAIHEAEKDPEHVHQLRVATRRCRAALDLFRECIEEKTARTLRRTLRELRRSAGPARDADVFLHSLQVYQLRAGEAAQPGLHWLAGYSAAHRFQAQACLESHGPVLLDRLQDVTRRMFEELQQDPARKDPTVTVGEVARRDLEDRLDELEDKAAGDTLDEMQLHQVRIAGKRLRYAMEIFAACFPPEFRNALYLRVEEMQEILGDLNDCHVAISQLAAVREFAQRFLPAAWPTWRIGVERLLTGQRRRLTNRRKRFQRFWSAWIEADISGEFTRVLTAH